MTGIHSLSGKILKMRGKKSFGLIAKELGVSRNVVAGVRHRADYPGDKRRAGRDDPRHKSEGKRGGSLPRLIRARQTLKLGRPFGASE